MIFNLYPGSKLANPVFDKIGEKLGKDSLFYKVVHEYNNRYFLAFLYPELQRQIDAFYRSLKSIFAKASKNAPSTIKNFQAKASSDLAEFEKAYAEFMTAVNNQHLLNSRIQMIRVPLIGQEATHGGPFSNWIYFAYTHKKKYLGSGSATYFAKNYFDKKEFISTETKIWNIFKLTDEMAKAYKKWESMGKPEVEIYSDPATSSRKFKKASPPNLVPLYYEGIIEATPQEENTNKEKSSKKAEKPKEVDKVDKVEKIRKKKEEIKKASKQAVPEKIKEVEKEKPKEVEEVEKIEETTKSPEKEPEKVQKTEENPKEEKKDEYMVEEKKDPLDVIRAKIRRSTAIYLLARGYANRPSVQKVLIEEFPDKIMQMQELVKQGKTRYKELVDSLAVKAGLISKEGAVDMAKPKQPANEEPPKTKAEDILKGGFKESLEQKVKPKRRAFNEKEILDDETAQAEKPSEEEEDNKVIEKVPVVEEPPTEKKPMFNTTTLLIFGGLGLVGFIIFMLMKGKKSKSETTYQAPPQPTYQPEPQPVVQQSSPEPEPQPVQPKSTDDYLSKVMSSPSQSNLPPTIQQLKKMR